MIIRLALFYTLLTCFSAHAGEVHIASKSIRFTGSAETGDAALTSAVTGSLDGANTLEIATNSGDLDAAMAIRRHVQQHGLRSRTFLTDCRDICALIWLAGQATPLDGTDRVRFSKSFIRRDKPIVTASLNSYLISLDLPAAEKTALLSEMRAAFSADRGVAPRKVPTVAVKPDGTIVPQEEPKAAKPGKTVTFRGPIDRSHLFRFNATADVHDGDITVDVSTTTGDPDTAMAIGHRIQKSGYGTRTDLKDCRDICALIWLAGIPHSKADKTRVHLVELEDHPGVDSYLQALGLNVNQRTALGSVPQDTEPSKPNLADYIGDTKDGAPHGDGLWTLGNGDTFTGTFRDGAPHGSGVVQTAEGDRMDVVFDNGRITGNPELKSAGGVVVQLTARGYALRIRHEEAIWFSAAPVSKTAVERQFPGVSRPAVLADGSQYEGSLKNGKPHGFGKQSYPDGTTFTGVFAGGKKNGPGILVPASGKQQAGVWRSGVFQERSAVWRDTADPGSEAARTETQTAPQLSLATLAELTSGMSQEEVRRLQARLNDLHYRAGPADGRIGRRTRTAIDAYARDFELARQDRYAADLIRRIAGEVPEARPGWRSIDGQDCQVFSQIVHAISRITWSGDCIGGRPHGRGVLKVTHRLTGKPVTYVYEGDINRGRLSGSGAEHWDGPHPAAGSRYEGGFINGLRQGIGTYSEPGLGRIEGSFDTGKPHGYAEHFDDDGKLLASGEFRAGCLSSGSRKLAVLTTRQACGF